MNINVLKVILIGAILKICSANLNYSYYIQSFFVKEVKFKSYDFLTSHNQVALSAWKQGEEIPAGTYSLYIATENAHKYDTSLKIKLGEIEYNGTEHKGWVRIPELKWIDVPSKNIHKEELFSWAVVLKNINVDTSDKKFSTSLVKNWTFNVFIKVKNEPLEGIREDENLAENPTKKYCSDHVTAAGKNKVLTALCPLNPITHIPMSECLNWRRIDQVGILCYSVLNEDEKENSMDVFCAKDPWFIECKCINRRYYKEYIDRKPTETNPDYCWYIECAHDYYLVKRKQKRVYCVTRYCNTTHLGGDKYMTICYRRTSGDPGYANQDE